MAQSQTTNAKPVTQAATDATVRKTLVTVVRDEFDTYTYRFHNEGWPIECRDFTTEEEAYKAAAWHLQLIDEGASFDVADGIGAIYRGSQLAADLRAAKPVITLCEECGQPPRASKLAGIEREKGRCGQ